MARKSTIGRTPRDLASLIKGAERELVQPPGGTAKHEKIFPGAITVQPELFQPREFTTALDTDHVTKLARIIATKGELEPPLVVRLRKKWVCVDGHHRLAAYKQRDWKELIDCVWFAGTIRDALDESVRRNTIAKLDMRRGDKYEAAWQRVVMGGWSKSSIVRLTGVSDGLVGLMRRVAEAHKRQDAFGRDLRAKLRGSIDGHSWTAARNAYNDISPAEWDHRKEAEKLARQLRSRMETKLSKNAIVTALALAIYDEELARKLPGSLREAIDELDQEARGDVEELGDPRAHR